MSAAVAPLDQFFAQLMRAQSFRARAREAAESFGTPKKRKNAMNSLTKIETKNELAPLELSDSFIEYADAIAPQFIVGDLLEFSKGDYLAGQNNTLVPMGTVFTVNMDELMAGWVRWWDGKPTDHVMVRVANRAVPNKPPGDDDETKWETDASGEPRNPWALTNYVPMMNEKGELFTFTTGSKGGRGAIALLSRRYGISAHVHTVCCRALSGLTLAEKGFCRQSGDM
jgi:hypothetical protein